MADEFDPYAKGVEYQITQVDPTDPETKGMVYQVHKVTEEVAALLAGKVYRARIIKDPDEPTIAGKVYQVTFIDDPDDPTVKGKVYNAICTGSSVVVVVGPGVSPLDLPDAIVDSLEYVKAYGDCENRNLPEGYQELEYIEGNSANQYINTGIVPTSSMEYYAKCAVLERISNSFPVFGARASNGGNDGVGAFVGSGTNTRIDSFFFTESGTEYRWQLDNVNTYGDIYEITFKNALQEVIKNGSSLGTKQYTPTTTCDKPLYVGSLNNGGAQQAGEWTYRFYRFTIDGIADMRPARRLSDGVLGMYDTIRKRFFTNAGTGSFIAGAALTLPEGYTRIEYIEGNNNVQYINTGIVPTSSMSMYFKGQFVSVDESTPTQVAFFMGARDVGAISGVFFQEASMTTSLDFFQAGTRWATSHTRAVNDIVELKVKNALAEVFINGSSIGTNQFTPNETTQYPIFLNALNNIGQPFNSNINVVNRIYRFTIDGVADFVPARRDSDGAIGMFNVLNNQFYGNAGTGTFTAGGVVAPTPTAPQDIWCNNGAIKAIRPIKYLECTGTQYIDTGVLPTLNTKLVVKATRIAVGGFAGSRDGADANSTMMAFATNGTSVIIDFNNGNNVPYRVNHTIGTGIITIIAESSKDARRLYDENGTLLAENTTVCSDTFTATKNMTLFNCNGGSISGGCRIYYAQIWDGDTLIRDFIPALDANNIPCMFDKVEGKCYYNAGTGQFIAGYLPAEYEELDYIQGASNVQYINTNIIPNSSMSIYAKVQLVSDTETTASFFFGGRTQSAGGTGVAGMWTPTELVFDWFGSSNADRYSVSATRTTGDVLEYTINNSLVTIKRNGTVAGTHQFTPIGTSTQPLYINGMNNGGTVVLNNSAKARIYRFTVAGVCDMIPARKRSNGHIGMYDLIRRQFFENAGEGQFTFGKLPILPETYTQLDYIESTGTQYLNTGVANNQVASYDITVQATQAPETGRAFLVFGSRNSATVANITSTLTPTNACSDFGDYNSTRLNPTIDFPLHKLRFVNSATSRTITDLDTGTVYSSTSAYTGTFSGSTTLRIGQVTTGGASTWDNFVGKIFECKVYQNDVLVKYLIPAKRNSDGVVGMYDVVNDVFHTNEGTGDFEYGSEIPDSRESYYCVDGDVETIATKAGGSTLSTATCENLLGIGSTQDVQEILTGEVTRKSAVVVLDGSEVWVDLNNQHQMYQTPAPNTVQPSGPADIVSTHFVSSTEPMSNMPNHSAKFAGAGAFPDCGLLMFKETDFSGVSQWTAWLRQQYDNGTPVVVVYPLSADETESVAGQTLTVSDGDNTVEIIQASIDNLLIEAKYEKEG